MKLHFTALNENPVQALSKALESSHVVTRDPQKLEPDHDGLVVGITTQEGDADVCKARELGVKIYGIGDLIYLLSEDKQRIVISGSNQTGQVVSFVTHVLNAAGKEFDFAIWQSVGGSGPLVKLSEAPMIVMEGSGDPGHFGDQRPQFLSLHHHITLITELQHQHEERYPSFDEYVREFDRLADATPKGGTVLYCEDDDLVTVIGGKERFDVKSIPYTAHAGTVSGQVAHLTTDNGSVEVEVGDEKALAPLGAAFALLKRLSVTEDQFYQAIQTYTLPS